MCKLPWMQKLVVWKRKYAYISKLPISDSYINLMNIDREPTVTVEAFGIKGGLLQLCSDFNPNDKRP